MKNIWRWYIESISMGGIVEAETELQAKVDAVAYVKDFNDVNIVRNDIIVWKIENDDDFIPKHPNVIAVYY